MAYYYNITAVCFNSTTGTLIPSSEASGILTARISQGTNYSSSTSTQLTIGNTLSGWTNSVYYIPFNITIDTSFFEFEKIKFSSDRPSLPAQREQTFTNNQDRAFYSSINNIYPYNAADINITIYVTEKPFTITLNPSGGSVSPTSILAYHNKKYGTLPTPSLSGSTFLGWFTSSVGGEEITSETVFDLDLDQTLYAQWDVQTPTIVTVSFNAASGTVTPSSKTCIVGQPYGDLPTPTRTNYKFIGWFTASSGGEEISNTTICATRQNHYLYAHWTNAATIPYSASTSTLTTYCQNPYFLFSENISQNSISGLPDFLHVCSRINNFICTKLIVQGAESVFTSSIFFGSEPTLPGGTIEASGVISTTSDKGMTETSSIDISGVSGRNTTYRLYWDGTFIKYRPDSIQISFNESNLKTNGKKPYGWCVGWQPPPPNGPFIGYLNGVTNLHIQLGATLTIPTEWIYSGFPPKVYVLCIPLIKDDDIIVTFDPNGGILVGNTLFIRVYKGQQYGTLPSATRQGYTFNGWFTAATGGSRVTASTTVTRTDDHILYAHWTSTTAHTLTFDATGGTVTPPYKTLTEGSPYGQLPTPTYANHSFQGWWTASSGGEQVSANTLMGDSDVTVYAHWDDTKIDIEFIGNGGIPTTQTKSYVAGVPYGILPTVVRDSFLFDGWWTASEGGIRIFTSTIVDSTIVTLYAHWRVPQSFNGIIWAYEKESQRDEFLLQ